MPSDEIPQAFLSVLPALVLARSISPGLYFRKAIWKIAATGNGNNLLRMDGQINIFFLIVLFVLYCQLCFLFDNFCLSLCSSFSVDLVNITGRSQVCFFSVLFFSSVNKFSSSLQKGSDVKNENEHLLIKAKRKKATQEKWINYAIKQKIMRREMIFTLCWSKEHCCIIAISFDFSSTAREQFLEERMEIFAENQSEVKFIFIRCESLNCFLLMLNWTLYWFYAIKTNDNR